MKFIFILYCDVGVLCITCFRLFPVDITVCHRGYHGDLNETFFVGNVDEKSKTLVRVTHECLCQAIDLGRSHKLSILLLIRKELLWHKRNCVMMPWGIGWSVFSRFVCMRYTLSVQAIKFVPMCKTINYTHRFNKVEEGGILVSPCPSVRLWTKSCTLCIFWKY